MKKLAVIIKFDFRKEEKAARKVFMITMISQYLLLILFKFTPSESNTTCTKSFIYDLKKNA